MIKTTVSKGQRSTSYADTVFTIDSGHTIGWDMTTSQETSKLRVLFDEDHNLKTAYPSEH